MKRILLLLIAIYQTAISPLFAPRCRFYPTCSHYAKTALYQHTLFKALQLIVRRLSRCHPLGGSGIDFVPLPLYREHYQYCHQKHHCVMRDELSYRARLNNYYKN